MSPTSSTLTSAIKQTKEHIKIGNTYAHYKDPTKQYTVLHLAIQEATEKVCLVYQAQYGEKLIFVRDVDNWLEIIDHNGQKVPRFKQISPNS